MNISMSNGMSQGSISSAVSPVSVSHGGSGAVIAGRAGTRRYSRALLGRFAALLLFVSLWLGGITIILPR